MVSRSSSLIMINEIHELREKIRNTVKEEGLSKLLNTLAIQGNSALNRNESGITLNSLDLALLKLMMIDYLNSNSNQNK
ncbi:MAG: hypothetical protein ACPKPY_09100 [Nitrososphaeraceae archaeon]